MKHYNTEYNKKFIMNYLEKDGMNLEKVSDYFKYDIDIVNIAIENNIDAFQFAGDYIRKNREFVLNYILEKEDGRIFEFADEELKNDKALAFIASFYGPIYYEDYARFKENLSPLIKDQIKNIGFITSYTQEKSFNRKYLNATPFLSYAIAKKN